MSMVRCPRLSGAHFAMVLGSIVLGAGCGGAVTGPGTGNGAPRGSTEEPSGSDANGTPASGAAGANGSFGGAAQGTGRPTAVDAGAAVTGPGFAPAPAGGSGGAPAASMPIGAGSSCAGAGGAPPASQAEVVTLAAGQTCPWGMAIDVTSVYWTTCGDPTGGSVQKVPKAGGAAVTLASGDRLSGIAVDATSVYWVAGTPDASSGAIRKVPIGGGTPITLVSRSSDPTHLAVDGSAVYWVEQRQETLTKVPLDGGDPVTVASAPTAWEFALGETDIYWLGLGVMKAPKAGGTAQALTASMFPSLPPSGIAVSASTVYFSSGPPSGVAGVSDVPVGGGAISVLYPGGPPGCIGGPIAIDATTAYWADGSNAIHAAPLAGGAATTIAADQDQVVAIAVDATGVYWLVNDNATAGQGAVRMLPLSALGR